MENEKVSYTKLITALFFIFYSFYYISTSTAWHFIDWVDLIFHEAGHTIFFFTGQFLTIAAGSGFQILFPAIFVLYFFFQRQSFSASIILFWVGVNFINVSVYARDAVALALSLLGGDSVIHDWNYLLSELNMLSHTTSVANILFYAGVLVILAASFLSLRFSLGKPHEF